MSRECPKEGGGGGGGGGDRNCFKCGEPGHMSRECPKEGGGGGGGGGGDRTCYKCGESGHMSRECTKEGASSSRGGRGGGFGGSGGGGFGGSKKEGGEEGADPERRERYIPEEQDDSETALFHNFETGINFTKQNEIPCNITGADADKYLNNALKTFRDAKLSDLMQKNIERSKVGLPHAFYYYIVFLLLIGCIVISYI